MSDGSVYGPGDYDAMFADRVRTPAYLEAIARVVGPDDIVVEIGTGVGYFAVAAARAGARHVYAIERESSVLIAAQVIRENECADRVTCIRGDANRVTLPERGTVLISDLRGSLPLMGDAIPTIMAARARLLVAGARLIPRRDVIRAAPCTAPAQWAATELTLGNAPAGISRASLASYARSCLRSEHLLADSLCAAPAEVAALAYESVTTPDVDSRLTWTLERSGRVEGVGLWFDTELALGVGFSTAPGGPKSVYSHAFLPFERALDANVGDRLECRIRARLVDGSYVFAWDTVFFVAGADNPVLRTSQSTLGALLASPADLARRQSSFRPDPARLSLDRDLLVRADGERSLAEIASELLLAHPGRFASHREALEWVTRRHAEFAGPADV